MAEEGIGEKNLQPVLFPDNLSEGKRRQVDAHLRVIESQYHPEWSVDDDRYKPVAEAFCALVDAGRETLPFLKSRLWDAKGGNEVIFSWLLDAVGEKEDLDMMLACAAENVSFISALAHPLARTIGEIRMENPADPRLGEIQKALVPLTANLSKDDSYNRGWVVKIIAATGTAEAKKFVEDNKSKIDEFHYLDALHFLEDSDNIPAARFHFPDWDEILQMREQDRKEKEAMVAGNTTAEERRFLDEAKTMVEKINPEKTLAPILELWAFNFANHNPGRDEKELQRFVERMQTLSGRETAASSEINPLPTVGVELECPETSLDARKSAILTACGIKNEFELGIYTTSQGKNVTLQEVKAGFSYSAEGQARLIQELAVLGAIPLEPLEKEGFFKSSFPEKEALSMHINLGVPTGIDDRIMQKHEAEATILNDILTYGYVSALRLESRKTRTSFSLKTDVGSSKKNAETAVTAKPAMARRSRLVRLELRAIEFRDFPTYRLLAEAQLLGAAFFSSIKKAERLAVTAEERVLAGIWNNFYQESIFLEEAFGVEDNLFDKDPAKAARVIRVTDIKTKARVLSQLYAGMVKKELAQSDVLAKAA